ncbi:MAG: hypothetical protein ACK4HW_06945 [Roseinatronobacter sp.]
MEFLFIFLGIDAIAALTVSNGGSDPEPDDEPEDLSVERDEQQGFVLRGTSGDDVIGPQDIEQAQNEVREERPFSGLSQIQAGADDDRIFANAAFDPDNPVNTFGQDNLSINGGAGADIILSRDIWEHFLRWAR